MAAPQSREAIVAQVKEIVAEVLKKTPAEIDEGVEFTDIGADSLDRMTLIVMLEDTLQGSISDEEAKTFKTVTDVVNYIESKQIAG